MNTDSSSDRAASFFESSGLSSSKKKRKNKTSPHGRLVDVKKLQTFGTEENAMYWFNKDDWCGILTATLVWILVIHCTFVVFWLTYIIDILSWLNVVVFSLFSMLVLWCHFKTMTTNPGAVPRAALSIPVEDGSEERVTMCAKCDAFKPPRAHHCRVCRRCIVRMDHHCPWVNNCVGVMNQKAFILFLVYLQILSIYGLVLSAIYFVYCETLDRSCVDNTPVTVTFAPTLFMLSLGSFLFTLAMLLNQANSVIRGIGTVDRVQRRRKNLPVQVDMTPDEKRFRWKRLFGSGPKFMWLVPVDIIYTDDEKDRSLEYSVPSESVHRGGTYSSMSYK